MKKDRPFFYRLEGDEVVPCGPEDWEPLPEGHPPLADTEIRTGVRVRTRFLGFDRNQYFLGPPELFETLVIRDGKVLHNWHYATWEHARLGHSQAVYHAARLGL